VMKTHYRDHHGEPFAEPEGIVHRVICEKSGLLVTPKCQSARREVFIEGTEPRRPCDRCSGEYKVIRTPDDAHDLRSIDRRLLEND